MGLFVWRFFGLLLHNKITIARPRRNYPCWAEMGYYHSAWSTYQSGTWFYFFRKYMKSYIWKSPSWGDVSIVPSHPSQRPVPGQSLPPRVSTKTRPTHASTIVFPPIPPFKIYGGPTIKVWISSRSNYGEGLKFLVSTSFSPRRHVTRCRSRDWAHNKAPVLSTCKVEKIISWYWNVRDYLFAWLNIEREGVETVTS